MKRKMSKKKKAEDIRKKVRIKGMKENLNKRNRIRVKLLAYMECKNLERES